MDKSAKNAAIAATIILGGFGIAAYFLPSLIRWVGTYSTIAAAIVAALFVAAFFAVFWLRGRSQGGEGS